MRETYLFHSCSMQGAVSRHCAGGQVVPKGLVGEGKSTNALLQSSTFAASNAWVAVPFTTIRLSVEAKIGRLTPLSVRLASEEITSTSAGESAATLFSVITSG